MNQFQHNTFRVTDALEFADAYRRAMDWHPSETKYRRAELATRMAKLSGDPPSYMLAAYRAYEAALLFKEQGITTTIIKLNDLDPTPVT